MFKEGTVESSPESLKRFMALVLKEMFRNEDSWPFREPVRAEDVRDFAIAMFVRGLMMLRETCYCFSLRSQITTL